MKKAYLREYYRRNKEKIAERNRDYYARNKDKITAYYREYYRRKKGLSAQALNQTIIETSNIKQKGRQNDMEVLNINGVDYIPADTLKFPKKLGNKIVIAPNGFIFVGEQIECKTDFEAVTLTNAYVVRKWDNGKGIGGLAKAEYKDEYELDACYGAITIPLGSVDAIIDCQW